MRNALPLSCPLKGGAGLSVRCGPEFAKARIAKTDFANMARQPMRIAMRNGRLGITQVRAGACMSLRAEVKS
ncbi:hypothetical protein NBRC116596_03550 [Litorivita sp. NS0012-18]